MFPNLKKSFRAPGFAFEKNGFSHCHMWLMVGQKVTELEKGNQGKQGNQATKGIHEFFLPQQKKISKKPGNQSNQSN